MPKLLKKDQEMFNQLLKCQHDCIDKANRARKCGLNKTADWFIEEVERCSHHMDAILAKYEEPKIITTYINGTTVTGTKEYVERMRRALTERTVNINVQVVVRPVR